MAEINVEMLKERLYIVASALFRISETCVDVSKLHISEKEAFNKIRGYLNDAGMWSKLKVDQLIEECMEPQIYNWFEDYGKKHLEVNGFDYPDCCASCSNNPKNGGSGICNCALPYLNNPTIYASNASTDDYCMTATTSTGVYILGKDKSYADNQTKANAKRIDEAVERTKKYVRK